MDFLKNIVQSIYGPKYYQELLDKPFSYSLKYYLLLSLLLVSFVSALLPIFIGPRVSSFFGDIFTGVIENYPAGLEVVVKNGQASSNVEEPYFIKLPEKLKGKTADESESAENFLVIDTKNDFSPELFKGYKTLGLLGRDSFAYYDNGKISIKPLKGVLDFTVNEQVIYSLLGKIKSFFRSFLPLFFFVAFFCFLFAIPLLRLPYLLLAALLIWAVAAIKKIKISYGKAYQLGLHLMTFGLLFAYPLFFLAPSFSIPFLFTATVVILAFVNFEPKPASAALSSVPLPPSPLEPPTPKNG